MPAMKYGEDCGTSTVPSSALPVDAAMIEPTVQSAQNATTRRYVTPVNTTIAKSR